MRHVFKKFQPPKAAGVLSSDVLGSLYAKEAEKTLDTLVEAVHLASISTLFMEESKDKSAVGLFGLEMEGKFVRGPGATGLTVAHITIIATMVEMLLEMFPEDSVLVDDDVASVIGDEKFLAEAAMIMSDFGISKGTTAADVARFLQHCGTYNAAQAAGEQPKRFWTIKPVDSAKAFRASKQWCMNVSLIDNGEPVLGFIACPMLSFDHASRSVPSPKGCPIYYAVKDQGAWIQLVNLERDQGVYQGIYRLKGPSLPLKAEEKIERGKDALYGFLGSEQLTITMRDRQREDIFDDAKRMGKMLGSDYPKFAFFDSSLKYCWLAGGKADLLWEFPRGLYDKTSTERLVDHAAGALLAGESGAKVTDLDGKSINWATGKILSENRGILATDTNKVPLESILEVIGKATVESNELYLDRCEKRKEVSLMLGKVFKKMGELAEGEQETRGAEKVLARGMEMLKDEQEMDKVTQEDLNRDSPILGESAMSPEDASFSGDGPVPLSPVGGDS